MKLVKHKGCSLPVVNYDGLKELNKKSKHGELFPNSIRALVVGRSNAGKTNLVLSMLTHRNGLVFRNVYVCSKSLHQTKYKLLEKIMKPLPNMKFYGISNVEDIPEKPEPFSVFIFDDLSNLCHKMIMRYFSYCRHFDVDCFYLGQTYSKINKQLIRDNANFIILFKQDEKNLRHVYDDHISLDISWVKFLKMCKICWLKPFSFIVIDKENNNFRRGLDEFFVLDKK